MIIITIRENAILMSSILTTISRREAELFISTLVSAVGLYSLRYAVGKKRLVMEPFIDIRTNEIKGYELLNRSSLWPRREWEWIAWNKFLLQTIRDICNVGNQDIYYAINLNADQIVNKRLMRALQPYMHPNIILEWTESGISMPVDFWVTSKYEETMQAAAATLKGLRKSHGVRISIDDAGSQSGDTDSLARLFLTSPDYIKVDGHLFQQAVTHPNIAKLCTHICAIAVDIGAISIVEWIETKKDLDFAKRLGAHMGQGYLWKALNIEKT